MDELQVVLQQLVVRLTRVCQGVGRVAGRRRPEDIVVVGKGGKEETQEEAGSYEYELARAPIDPKLSI